LRFRPGLHHHQGFLPDQAIFTRWGKKGQNLGRGAKLGPDFAVQVIGFQEVGKNIPTILTILTVLIS
jgi:hypothetical protein